MCVRDAGSAGDGRVRVRARGGARVTEGWAGSGPSSESHTSEPCTALPCVYVTILCFQVPGQHSLSLLDSETSVISLSDHFIGTVHNLKKFWFERDQ